MTAYIDGARIHTKAELHRALARELSFPEWYGGNLDALYDCLTDIREDTFLRIAHWDSLLGALGHYGEVLERVLHDAAGEDGHFTFSLEV